MARKPPYRHDVSGYYRNGKWVDDYERGKGNAPQKERRVSRKEEKEESLIDILVEGEGGEITTAQSMDGYLNSINVGIQRYNAPSPVRRIKLRRMR